MHGDTLYDIMTIRDQTLSCRVENYLRLEPRKGKLIFAGLHGGLWFR